MKWQLVANIGYCARYAFIGAAFLWLSFLAYIFVQQPDTNCSSSTFGRLRQQQQQQEAAAEVAVADHHPHFVATECSELRRKLDHLNAELLSLQDENRQLKKLAASRDFRPVEPGQFLLQKPPEDGGSKIDVDGQMHLHKVEPLVVAAERRLYGQLYSKEHELARRDLHNSIWELHMKLTSAELKQLLGKEAGKVEQQLVHLLAQSRSLSLVDRADEWHRRTLDRVRERIEESLERLQNPSDCAVARLMVCELNKGCGFGCQLHHVTYCLLMAVAANRTLVLDRDGTEWRYSEHGWTAAFQPIGKCTWAAHVSPTAIVPFTDLHQSARIVRLPIVDGLAARPEHLPLAFPAQFADLLLTHHSNPPVFFIAQFLAFLMRENEQTRDFVDKAEKQIPFHLGPVVGLQIRRTDKVGTEAAFHSLEEYMHWADLWFRVERTRLGGLPMSKRVFIATDDRSVIAEARDKYGPQGWSIFANDEAAEVAQLGSRYSDRSLLGVIADVRILSKCSYIVCTFSSQVCRMGYELMQTIQGDAGDRVHSLDDIFYFGGQNAHELEAIGGYQAEGHGQIDLLKGDIIGIAGNHWDGWSKGTNRRTGQNGLFPSYLAREKWRIVDFPVFEN